IQSGLRLLAESRRVALCLPTLPLPPIELTPGAQAAAMEMELTAAVATFGKWAASQPRIRLASPEKRTDHGSGRRLLARHPRRGGSGRRVVGSCRTRADPRNLPAVLDIAGGPRGAHRRGQQERSSPGSGSLPPLGHLLPG